jgi:hypothetical protein
VRRPQPSAVGDHHIEDLPVSVVQLSRFEHYLWVRTHTALLCRSRFNIVGDYNAPLVLSNPGVCV